MRIEAITNINSIDLSSLYKILTSTKITESQKLEFINNHQTQVRQVLCANITCREFKDLMQKRPLQKFKPLKNSFTKRGDKILLAKTLGIEPNQVDNYIDEISDDIEKIDGLTFLPKDKMETLKTYVYRHGSKDNVINFLDYELKMAKDRIKTIYSTMEYHTGGMADYFIRPIHRMDKKSFERLYRVVDKNIKLCQKEGLIDEAESSKIAKWALIKLYLIKNNSTLINAVKTYKKLSQ